MRFYIASSLKNDQQVRDLAAILKAAGWTHTYDWTVPGPANAAGAETLRAVGEEEFAGVKSADIVIVLTPGGRGTHTELGMAIALEKTVYLCHSDTAFLERVENTPSFYWLSQVKRIVGGTEDIAREVLRANGA